MTTYQINDVTKDDFAEWSALFRDYLVFYETSIPDEQYNETFNRIVNNVKGLRALALRATENGESTSKVVGFAHFFPDQTTWSDKGFLFLEGTSNYRQNSKLNSHAVCDRSFRSPLKPRQGAGPEADRGHRRHWEEDGLHPGAVGDPASQRQGAELV